MKRTRPRNRKQLLEAVTGSSFETIDAPLFLVFDSRIQWRLFRRGGGIRGDGNSTDRALKVCKALAEDNNALVRDFIFANILCMIPAPHLDNHHDFAKLAI